MKIALCTTTVHVPHALKLMRKCSDSVRFFVATDKKTPLELGRLQIENVFCMRGDFWKCSEAIGFDTLSRRNIAFLEALKWGADVIYSWDNDNLPVNIDHFDLVRHALKYDFDGMRTGKALWFDPGFLLTPPVKHRGMPHRYVGNFEPVVDAKVGVAAGLVLGDPDIDAVTRIADRPDVQIVNQIGQTGVVVDPHTWTVFNTQNTAVIRELIPAWFLMPGVGRHDDIYASLVVQRVARERNLHVHFGPPFTYQQRNEHDPIKDLRAEIDGMENVEKLAALLDSIVLPGREVILDVDIIYSALRHCDFLPKASVEAAFPWLEDCREAMA